MFGSWQRLFYPFIMTHLCCYLCPCLCPDNSIDADEFSVSTLLERANRYAGEVNSCTSYTPRTVTMLQLKAKYQHSSPPPLLQARVQESHWSCLEILLWIRTWGMLTPARHVAASGPNPQMAMSTCPMSSPMCTVSLETLWNLLDQDWESRAF